MPSKKPRRKQRKPETPRSRVRAAIRLLWLRSRERAAAMKAANYSCERCGVHQSVAKNHEQKIEVHHKAGIGNWEAVIDLIFQEILCNPGMLECLCPECHKEEHKNE
jgi:predicted HNH restriction endonuclease